MVFSSMAFLCVYLPVIFLLYHLVPGIRIKNILLLVFSLVFYAYGEPIYVLLLLFSTIMNYFFGRLLGHMQLSSNNSGNDESGSANSDNTKQRAVLAIAIAANLGILIIFKYTDFIIGTANSLFGVNIKLTEIMLPIGISFFTFQAMSYLIDVYRNEVRGEKSYLNISLYISFFPQLTAGPIIKYYDIEEQLRCRTSKPPEIAQGLRRFILGLAKKVLIANTVAVAADALFSTPTNELFMLSAWIAAVGYMLQLYYDFSGYSDMAIGLGHMFGFTFKENFNYPYSARSIKDFWRRWHISLTTWFKEYVYIPLGGNRKGRLRTCINKIIVFLITGLWHGANWTFVVWGLFHGFFLLLEDFVPFKKLNRLLLHVYTILVVCVGFVIFRADTIGQGMQIIGKMFTGADSDNYQEGLAMQQLTPVFIIAVAIGCVFSFPVLLRVKDEMIERPGFAKWAEPAGYALSFILLVVCILSLSGEGYNPFIYFRF